MYAIFERERGHLSFADAIAAAYKGRWQEGVTLAPLPCDLYTLPDGLAWPERVVGVCLVDHSHYRVFSYAAEVNGSGFRPTGLIYGGTFDLFPSRAEDERAPATNGPEKVLVPQPVTDPEGSVTEYRTGVAGDDAERVRSACRTEGFDANRTDQVVARHRRQPQRLEPAGDVAAQYVRYLARSVSESEDRTGPDRS